MFIDDLFLHGVELPRMHRLFAKLPKAQVYRIDEVVRYAVPHFEELGRIELARDMPNIAPLAPVVWFEWDALNVRGQRLAVSEEGKVGAALVVTHTTEGTELPGRWLSEFLCMSQLHDGTTCWQRGVWGITIGPEGGPLWAALLPNEGVEGDLTKEETWSIQISTAICLLATCFAHCKGVQTTEHKPPRQQRRARQRAGEPEMVSYRTVDIRPVTRMLRDEGQVEKTGLKRALHICRGNFADYTEDN